MYNVYYTDCIVYYTSIGESSAISSLLPLRPFTLQQSIQCIQYMYIACLATRNAVQCFIITFPYSATGSRAAHAALSTLYLAKYEDGTEEGHHGVAKRHLATASLWQDIGHVSATVRSFALNSALMSSAMLASSCPIHTQGNHSSTYTLQCSKHWSSII